jgi:hypothetical protein
VTRCDEQRALTGTVVVQHLTADRYKEEAGCKNLWSKSAKLQHMLMTTVVVQRMQASRPTITCTTWHDVKDQG